MSWDCIRGTEKKITCSFMVKEFDSKIKITKTQILEKTGSVL
jgi:hypothetical protein